MRRLTLTLSAMFLFACGDGRPLECTGSFQTGIECNVEISCTINEDCTCDEVCGPLNPEDDQRGILHCSPREFHPIPTSWCAI